MSAEEDEDHEAMLSPKEFRRVSGHEAEGCFTNGVEPYICVIPLLSHPNCVRRILGAAGLLEITIAT